MTDRLLAAARNALVRIESDIESPGRTTPEGDALRAAIAAVDAAVGQNPSEGSAECQQWQHGLDAARIVTQDSKPHRYDASSCRTHPAA